MGVIITVICFSITVCYWWWKFEVMANSIERIEKILAADYGEEDCA